MGASCSLDIKRGQDARTTNLNIWDAPFIILIQQHQISPISSPTQFSQITLIFISVTNHQSLRLIPDISNQAKGQNKLTNEVTHNET